MVESRKVKASNGKSLFVSIGFVAKIRKVYMATGDVKPVRGRQDEMDRSFQLSCR